MVSAYIKKMIIYGQETALDRQEEAALDQEAVFNGQLQDRGPRQDSAGGGSPLLTLNHRQMMDRQGVLTDRQEVALDRQEVAFGEVLDRG